MSSESTPVQLSSPLLTGDLMRPDSVRFIHALRHHPDWQEAIVEAISRYSAEDPKNAAPPPFFTSVLLTRTAFALSVTTTASNKLRVMTFRSSRT